MKKTSAIIVLILAIGTGLFAQKNVVFRSNLQYPGIKSSNIWGYSDSFHREFALVGLDTGVSIVNITNPDSVFEVQFVPGPRSIWREIKTWSHYAYVTNETGKGLLIIDLANLPNAVDTAWWTADTIKMATAHTLFIDEHGFLYLNGWNNLAHNLPTNERAVLIADLNIDPMHPTYVGRFDKQYVHDSYARGDTLWVAEIYMGGFEILDVRDKTHPISMGFQETPSHFTHNLWLSDDGKSIFTTDERSGAYIASYDVSDITNIRELCRYQSQPLTGVIPHNAYFLNNYVIASYYKNGIIILDAHDPANMIEVGNYDTSPYASGDGFNGCWGVYPFLPSGNIIASDIEEGLFVLTPDYVRAAYVRGTVTNIDNLPLGNVHIEVMGTASNAISNTNGTYRTGASGTGVYDIRFTGTGCPTHIVSNVIMTAGDTLTLDWKMNCTTTTGIGDLDDKQAYINASPSGNSLLVNFRTHGSPDAHINLYDLTGRLLHAWSVPNYEGQIEVNIPLSHGMYVLQMQDAEKSLITKTIY